MCPEMIRKDCKSMEKADVWSYGVVMMEIASAPPLFSLIILTIWFTLE